MKKFFVVMLMVFLGVVLVDVLKVVNNIEGVVESIVLVFIIFFKDVGNILIIFLY